jgi:hypothetical protein
MNVANFIDFVNVKAKILYDNHHKLMTFNIEDKVYLQLHRDYFLSEDENFKLSNQRSDSYTVLRRVDSLTYELNMSITSRVHSVISVAQLKSASDMNPFNKSRSNNSDPVEMKDDIATKKFYEVERILKKRTQKYEKITIIQYLVK